jgi:hypothetical protein
LPPHPRPGSVMRSASQILPPSTGRRTGPWPTAPERHRALPGADARPSIGRLIWPRNHGSYLP